MYCKKTQYQIKTTDFDDLKTRTATPSPRAVVAEITTPDVTSLMQRVTRDFDFWRYFVNEGNVNTVMAGNWKTLVTMEEARQILAYFRGTVLDAIAKTDDGLSHLVGRTLYELREFFCGALDCGEVGYKVLRELTVGSLEGSERIISLKMQKERLVAFMCEVSGRRRSWMTASTRTRSFVTPKGSEFGYELGAPSSSPCSLLHPIHECADSDECKMFSPMAPVTPFDDGLRRFAIAFGAVLAVDSPHHLASFDEEDYLELELDSAHESEALVSELDSDSSCDDPKNDDVKNKGMLRVLVTFDDSEEKDSEIETEDELEFYDGHCSRITTRSPMTSITCSSMPSVRHSIVSSLTTTSEKPMFERLALAMHAPF